VYSLCLVSSCVWKTKQLFFATKHVLFISNAWGGETPSQTPPTSLDPCAHSSGGSKEQFGHVPRPVCQLDLPLRRQWIIFWLCKYIGSHVRLLEDSLHLFLPCIRSTVSLLRLTTMHYYVASVCFTPPGFPKY